LTARDTQRVFKFGVVRDCVRRAVPHLNDDQVTELLEAAKAADGRALKELSLHLADHPEALISGESDCPPSMVRFTHALYDAGHTHIARPPCGGCGRIVTKLPSTGPQGRLCSNCAQLKYLGDCSRCGRPEVRIAARRPEGLICQRCYRVDPEVVEPCAQCGRVRQAAARMPDGAPLCYSCWQPPKHRCALCGTEDQAVVIDGDGPVCRSCYERFRRPQRLCSRCGKVGRISISPADGSGEICANCNRGPIKECAACGNIRACRQHGPDRAWTCGICRRAADVCARCQRLRPVQVRWPIGPVCATCYAAVLDTPGACGQCQATAPLVGRDEQGSPLCGPCCGLPAHTCRRCGRAGRRYADQVCARCVLEDRLNELLAPDNAVAEQLRPVYDAFLADPNPRGLIRWLARSPNARLLADLAARGEHISHESLDTLGPSRYEAYVRQMLVHTEVLSERDEDVERIPGWLEQRLLERPAEHASLVRPFVHWHLLRRARRRSLERRHPASAKNLLRRQASLALDLLSWLDEKQTSIGALSQQQLDEWIVSGGAQRGDIRSFIKWLQSRGLARSLSVAPRTSVEPSHFISEDERLDLLRKCLADESMPLDVRAAGALVLLFGTTLFRVENLTTAHITRRAEHTYLTIGSQPVLLPPRLAQLVERLPDVRRSRARLERAQPGTEWLFPGLNPGRPINRSHFEAKLVRHGISTRKARNAALISLAAELPSPVLADLFGLHISTAVRWAEFAKRDWADYVAQRADAQPSLETR